MNKCIKLIGLIIIIASLIFYNLTINNERKTIVEQQQNLEVFFDNYNTQVNEKDKTQTVLNNRNNENYVAVIEIPVINLKTGIVKSDWSFYSMNRAVSIYPTSKMPNEQNSNFILFAHNGNTVVSFFKNIYKLKKNDDIYVYYKSKKYHYLVTNNKEISMSNSTPVMQNKSTSTITLITCKNNNDNYRVVIEGELIENDTGV